MRCHACLVFRPKSCLLLRAYIHVLVFLRLTLASCSSCAAYFFSELDAGEQWEVGLCSVNPRQ